MRRVGIIRIGQISNDGSQCGTVISEEGLCSTICACTHGYANNHILREQIVSIKETKLRGGLVKREVTMVLRSY